MKKSMLKLTLAALALTAGAFAFAEGEAEPKVVQLSNGAGSVTWTDFVNALNNGAKGSITNDLAADNTLRLAYETAKQDSTTAVSDLEAKNITLGQKKKALEDAQKDVDTADLNKTLREKQAELATAQDTLDKYIKKLYKNYEDSIAYRDKLKNDSLPHVNQLVTNLGTQITLVKDSISDVENVISTTYTKKVSTSVNPTWLANMGSTATAFSDDFALKTSTNSPTIYYQYNYEYIDYLDEMTNSLTVSFVNPNQTGWTAAGAADLKTLISKIKKGYKDENNEDIPGVSSIGTVTLYLGTDYKNVTGKDSKIAGNTVALANIVSVLVTTLEGIEADSRFQTTTDETINPTDDRFFAANTSAEDKQKILDAYNAELLKLEGMNTRKSNYTKQQTDYSTLAGKIQDHINLLTNTLIQQALDKYNKAVAGTLTGDETFTTLTNDVNAAQEAVDDAQKAADVAATIDAAQTAYDEAEDAVEAAEAALATAKEKAEAAYAAAVAAANTAALANYNNVELNGDVNAEVATGASSVITSFSGTITGNNKVINVTGGNLFGTLTATAEIDNVAINGNLTGKNNGSLFNVAIWYGTSGAYYDDQKVRTTYASLGALGNAARATFGVDFANKKLTDLKSDNTNKVYDLTVYEINKAAMQMYATISSDDKGYYFNYVTDKGVNTSYLFPANTFAKCATADIATNFEDLPNVFYGANNTCDNVVITDQVNFYCPVEIAAANVTYNRSFSKGFNSLCLPFALTPAKVNNNELLTFDGEADGRFWFTTASTVAAGTPMILKAAEEFNNIVVTDVTISPIVDARKLLAGRGGQIGGGSLVPGFSCAVFQYSDVTEIIGSAESSRVFGLKGSEFQVAGENAKFKAFRMAIVSSYKSNPMPRKIGIRDEFGNDITEEETDGIANVEAEATSLGVTTAQGQIIFTSEADYGTVQVYGIDGRVAANATVMAGTTAIDVPAGMYIVLGKKVLVK